MRGNFLAKKKYECANDEGLILVKRRRLCRANTQRDTRKEVTREKNEKATQNLRSEEKCAQIESRGESLSKLAFPSDNKGILAQMVLH